MKHPLAAPQEPTLAQVRQQHLVAVTGPIWIFNVGLHSAAILRSVLALLLHGQGLQTTACEITNLAAYAVGHWLPNATIFFGRADLVETACITAHFVHSMVLSLLVFGVTDLPNAATAVLGARLELILCVILTFQYQLSLPVMAFLHAVRQTVWMCIILWRMDGDPHSLLVRGACNWTVLMLQSALIDKRIRSAHQRLHRVWRQQQQLEQQKPQEQQSLLPCDLPHSSGSTSISKQKSPVCSGDASSKPATDSSTSSSSGSRHGGLSATTGPSHTVAAPYLTPAVAPVQLTAAPPAVRSSGLPGTGPAGPAIADPLAVPETSTVQHAPALQAQGTSVLVGIATAKHPHLTPRQQHAAKELLQAIKHDQTLPYRRGRDRESDTVRVKLEGIELENMPPDLPKLLYQQLSYCMPGVTMTGLALRSGCVMLTLDLMRYAEEGMVALSADSMRNLITRLMQSQAMGQVPEHGAPICIQMLDELALCRWDSASGSYTSAGAPALDPSDWYSCRMVAAGPVVHCLSDNAARTAQRSGSSPGTLASHQLTLTMVLELPNNCQLHGWQPAGVADTRGLLQDSTHDGPVVNAMVLARRLDGGYLPVVVDQATSISSGNHAAQAIKTQRTAAQVSVSVAGEGPAAVQLELWLKQADAAGSVVRQSGKQLSSVPGRMPGMELLTAHMPLLVLPGRWKEAAAQLQQHVESLGGVQPQHALQAMTREAASKRSMLDMQAAQPLSNGNGTLPGAMPAASQAVGNTKQLHSPQPLQHQRSKETSDSASSHITSTGDSGSNAACCLLEDLVALLTHHWNNTSHTGRTSAVMDSVMSQLGDDLLVYTVQHGLGAVASLIVDAIQRADLACTALPPAPSRPSAWLLRVAGCASGGKSETRQSLLHAAMASGNAEILGHVLSWGDKYGGPNWAWPWELQDAAGCTALHRAAAQPAAGACAALLKTITCMLPSAQLQAARNAWLHCQGSVGVTPADLFTLASAGTSDTVGSMWSTDSPAPPDTGSAHASTSAGGSSGPSTTALAQPPCTPVRFFQPVQSWLGSMVEVWTTRESDEFRAWTKQQLSIFIRAWGAVVIALLAVTAYRSAVLGCLRYEILHLSLHGVAYLPILAEAVGMRSIGGWQEWMRMVRLMEAFAYYAKTFIPTAHLAAWAGSALGGADAFFVVVISPAIDQAPMYQILIERSCVAFARGLAYGVIGIPHPMRRSLLLQLVALIVSTVAGAQRLRAFKRAQARMAGRGQKGKQQLAPTSPRKCEGTGPRGEPQIPGQEPLALPSRHLKQRKVPACNGHVALA